MHLEELGIDKGNEKVVVSRLGLRLYFWKMKWWRIFGAWSCFRCGYSIELLRLLSVYLRSRVY